MHPAIPQAAATFAISAMLALHVALRRDKSSLHWHFLGLLVALLAWSGGAVWRYGAAPDDLQAAFRLMFLGIYTVPPLWMLLAARFARVEIVEERPDLVAAAVAPAVFFYLAFLTNDSHHLVAREIRFDRFVHGPLFWASVAWSYGCVAAGVVFFLRRARWMAARQERRRATLVGLAALAPVLGNATYLTGLVDWHHDPTPLCLGVTAAMLFTLVFRFGLLENLPLVRRDVIEHLHAGVLIADPQGAVVDANPAAEALLRTPVAALRHSRVTDLIASLAEGADPGVAERVAPLLADSPEPRTAEIRTADGRWLELNAAAVRGGSGDPAGRFVVLRDRTDARRFEGRVRQTQRLESVGLLAAGIAHEVNNPLCFVRANLAHLHRLARDVEAHAALLAEKPDAAACEELEEMPRVVEETLEGIERIARIVEGLRRLSRAEGDGAPEPVDVNEVVTEAVKLAGLRRALGVEVATDLATGAPAVSGSKDRLIQVVLNLLLNAKQALTEGSGGRVVAATRRLPQAVEIRVEDDGPGMSDAVQRRIFDAFFTTKGPEEGTGLGLPIAFDIVREHGGWMEVRSQEGEGACFTVRLPAAAPAGTAE